MSKMIKIAALAAASLLACAAQAASFTYSGTFANGSTVSGSFDGTQTGNLVTGLSNITLTFNGTPLVGAAALGGYFYGSSYNNGFQSGGATVSLNGVGNDFLFIDVDFPNSQAWDKYFLYDPADGFTGQVITQGGRQQTNTLTSFSVQGGESAVPEPATWGMMILGFGLVGAAMRRRTTVGFARTR